MASNTHCQTPGLHHCSDFLTLPSTRHLMVLCGAVRLRLTRSSLLKQHSPPILRHPHSLFTPRNPHNLRKPHSQPTLGNPHKLSPSLIYSISLLLSRSMQLHFILSLSSSVNHKLIHKQADTLPFDYQFVLNLQSILVYVRPDIIYHH